MFCFTIIYSLLELDYLDVVGDLFSESQLFVLVVDMILLKLLLRLELES